MQLNISIATTREQRETCSRLRHEVFVEEQSVPVALEIDDHDEKDAIHYRLLFESFLPKVPI